MSDNKGELYNKQPVDTYTREEREAKRTNRNVIISVIIGIVIIAGVLIYLSQSGSHYDKGAEYLRQKQYSEAISEFQKVDAGDKNFAKAQSKLNYINGLMAFNNGLMPEAGFFLSKVSTDDEYYHDSQLMLQKIADANNTGNLQSQLDSLKKLKKDTVVIKQEITGTKKEKEHVTNPPTDAEINKKYTSSAEGLIGKFESLYEAAKTAPVANKRDYVNNMNDASRQFSSLSYNASVKDANIVELKRQADKWMNVRIQFINKLIADNTVSETNTSRASKEEGDKAYSMTMRQLQKVKSGL